MLKRILAKIRRESGKLCHKKPATFPNGRKVVSFSFDDFPASALETGGRILEANNIRGTYYAALGMAGKDNIPSREELLSAASRGHEVGSHTFSHLNCGESSPRTMEADCRKNQQVAHAVAGLELEHFAYPFGEFKPSTKKVAKNMFRSARTSEPGINRGLLDLSALRGVPIYERGGMGAIQPWIDRLRESDGWIIFYTHDVCHAPTDYGSTEALFTQTIAACREAGFEFMTVGEAARLCKSA